MEKTFGDTLRFFRECKALTQREMAEKIGCHVATYSAIETGRPVITSTFIESVEKILKLQPSDTLQLRKLAKEENFQLFDTNKKVGEDEVLYMREYVAREGRIPFDVWKSEFNIASPTILAIVRGKTFKYLPGAIPEYKGVQNGGIQSLLSDQQIEKLYYTYMSNTAYYSSKTLAKYAEDVFGVKISHSAVLRNITKYAKEKGLPFTSRKSLSTNSGYSKEKRVRKRIVGGEKVKNVEVKDQVIQKPNKLRKPGVMSETQIKYIAQKILEMRMGF